jgi:phosphate transport system protein
MTRAEFHQHLDRLRDDTLALGDLAVAAVERAVGALQEDDRAAAAAIVAGDRELDERHTAIQGLAITLLATQQPTAGDLRAIAAALATAGELERIGDYAEGAARLILRAPDEPPFPPSHTVYRMAREAVAMLRRSLDAYARRDAGLARRVWAEDTTVDTFQRTLYEELLRAMMENPGTLTRATYLLWIVHNLERVADRATNICEQVVFMAEGRWPAVDRRERDGAGARPTSSASPTPEP